MGETEREDEEVNKKKIIIKLLRREEWEIIVKVRKILIRQGFQKITKKCKDRDKDLFCNKTLRNVSNMCVSNMLEVNLR